MLPDISIPAYTLYHGDCLEEMDRIEDGSVDMILADLPYGVTACASDVSIPFEPLWKQYKRVIKKNGAVVLFGSQPFTSLLVMSNLEWFRYEWIWDKERGSNFQHANKMPQKSHENVLVFYARQPTYNPQFWYSTPYTHHGGTRNRRIEGLANRSIAKVGASIPKTKSENGERFPLSIQSFKKVKVTLHPSQKPVTLLSYLIRTYTNEGEIVLDNTFGSCSTGVSCLETGRRFIGIEKDPEYFRIGEERMRQKAMELGLQTNEAHSSYGKTDTDKSGYQLGLPQLQSQIHETA